MQHTNGVADTGNLIRRGLRKLPDTWAALLLIGAIFAAGAGAGAIFLQQKGLPVRVAKLEERADRTDFVRDSFLDMPRVRELLSGRIEERLAVGERQRSELLEDTKYIKDQNRRVICILQGNRGAACL